jgi:hypothetical protein
VIFERVGAQNDQFVQKALDRENVFELFMRIMNDPQYPARCLPFSWTMYELLSGLTAETRGTSCANCDGNDCRYSD